MLIYFDPQYMDTSFLYSSSISLVLSFFRNCCTVSESVTTPLFRFRVHPPRIYYFSPLCLTLCMRQFWIMLNYFLMAKKLENWILTTRMSTFCPKFHFLWRSDFDLHRKVVIWSLLFEIWRKKDYLFCGKQNQVEMVQTFLRRIHRTRKRSGRNFWDCH